MRQPPHLDKPVSIGDILDAMRTLDQRRDDSQRKV